MTQTPPPPPPLPPPPAERPRLSDDVWLQIADDYRAGDSTPVLAERYGVADRSVRRRAALEHWRRDADVAALRHHPRDRRAADHAVYPALATIEDLNGEDLHDLLFMPDIDDLCRFAFRRAAECAALDGPAQTAAWLRVARLSTALGAHREDLQSRYRRADYARAEMMHERPRPAAADD